MRNFFFVFFVLSSLTSCQKESKLIKLSGVIFGTTYNIQYFSEKEINYRNDILQVLNDVNQSLSTYTNDSYISKLNRNEITTVDHHFVNVFNISQLIYQQTEGFFDPTIGNVVNAWNFGAVNNRFQTDSTTIDSLMQFVGFNNVKLSQENRITKPYGTYLEFNAIAKGYGIDVVGDFLASKGISDYLIEIGGDMLVLGNNIKKQKKWTVGIDDPNFDGSQSYSKIMTLKDEAMATSGTYRKFKHDAKGNRYAHIINTTTGHPAKTNVLSVSVIAPCAMLADGYATAFQAMGVESVKTFLEQHSELKVYFIYEDDQKILKTMSLNGFPER